MAKKATKAPASKRPVRKAADKTPQVGEGSIANPPQPNRDDRENLRRRAEWFQRRASMGGERKG